MSDCPQLLTPVQQKHIQRQNNINQRRQKDGNFKTQQLQEEADKVLYKLGLMSLNVKNGATKRRPSEIDNEEEKKKTMAGLEFCSMVALQGDAEKLLNEAEEIALRLKEKVNDEVVKEEQAIVTNGYFGEESTGLKDENALKFCFDIPESQRTPSVWKLGAKILCDMSFYVTAEEWIRRCNDCNNSNNSIYGEANSSSIAYISGRGYVGGDGGSVSCKHEGEAEAQLLFQEIRTQRFFSHITEDLNAEVGFTIEKFRGLYAREEIPTGESIVIEEPILFSRAYSSNPDENLPACNACGKDLSSLEDYFGETIEKLISEVPPIAHDLKVVKSHWPKLEVLTCTSCQSETFCSHTCRQGYWDKHHQYICPGVNKHSKLLYDAYDEFVKKGKSEDKDNAAIFKELSSNSTPMMLLKLWTNILARAFEVAKEQSKKVTLREYQRACEPFRSFIGARFPFVESARELFSCLESILADGDAFPTPFTLNESEFEWRYSQIASNVQEFRPPESNLETWMTNVRNLQEERLWKLLQLSIRKSPKKVYPRPPAFSGMFVLHATTNHSCNHNCKVTSRIKENGHVAIDVVTLKPIQMGEELCIRYADVTLPRRERRDYLYKGWGFWCMCDKCKYEGDDQNICIHCQKVASDFDTFLACGRCKRAWYCSKECQRSNWTEGHKNVCKT